MARILKFRRRPVRRVLRLLSRVVIVAVVGAFAYLLPVPGLEVSERVAHRVDESLKNTAAVITGWTQKLPSLRGPGWTAGPAQSAQLSPSQNSSPASTVATGIAARVTRVIDGDTVDVRAPASRSLRIRLHGIDAPEYDQAFGRASRRALSRLVAREDVRLDVRDTDSHGRTVAVIWVRGLNANEAMVREGYAWWYRHYARSDDSLRSAEQEARATQRGLWRASNPVPPWEWRRQQSR